MTLLRPLPGLRFETQAQPLDDVLPRMDIPLFAGFAASGPLHAPVVVEDAAQFAMIFGGDVDLPAPRQSHEPRTALLGPAVRTFFRNGGRRCWIVRVAGKAVANRFAVPHLMRVAPDGTLVQAFAPARSEGSWSDAVRVQTNIAGTALGLSAFLLQPRPTVNVSGRDVQRGDLVRLTWNGRDLAMHLFVEDVKASAGLLQLTGTTVWVRPSTFAAVAAPTTSPPGTPIVERLVFDLTVRRENERPLRLSALGFAPDHPRWFGALPSDLVLARNDGKGPWQALWSEAASPRFALAAEEPRERALYLPAGMPVTLSAPSSAEPLAALPLERDGLAAFGPELFLDPNLADTDVRDLLDRADALRYEAGKSLTGIHAALGVEEATMIAAPDAVHRGWFPESVVAIPLTSPLSTQHSALSTPKRGAFTDCIAAAVPAAPTSPLSSPLSVRRFVSFDEEGDDAPTLRAVHRAMVRLCAARGDMTAILSLPRHYDAQLAIKHAAVLGETLEPTALSYAALWHPWVVGRDDDAGDPRAIPPDGAIAGVMAWRAITRGPWVAPANEPLQGIVALTPAIPAEALQSLQDAGINVVRQEPSGFICLDSDTLASDDDVRALNVRRLLIVLRRAALRRGNDWAFEPNSASLRNTVKRGFESLLSTMFARGAFAGTTAKNAYQVVTDASVNPPSGVDAGRLVAEIRVAPSRPLSFLTIRLVQRGDTSIVQEVR